MNDQHMVLIQYRIEQSDESLQSAELLYRNAKYRSSVNRAYYAMFYAVLSLLVTENNSISKHSGVISIFDKEYVKKEIFSRDMSKWLHEAFDLRQRADYTEMFTVSAGRADDVINNARAFVSEIKKFMKI